MTASAVADNRVKPTEEQIVAYMRREWELRERFLKGVRKPRGILDGFQVLLERDYIPILIVVPPPDSRLHTVHVRVRHDIPWQEAVDSAGHDTPDDYDIRKVGHLFPPQVGEGEEDIVLLNYTAYSDEPYDEALAWAKSQGLKATTPREVFALRHQHRELRTILNVERAVVVATTECMYKEHRCVCYVTWDDEPTREAGLFWLRLHTKGLGCWFAFRK